MAAGELSLALAGDFSSNSLEVAKLMNVTPDAGVPSEQIQGTSRQEGGGRGGGRHQVQVCC